MTKQSIIKVVCILIIVASAVFIGSQVLGVTITGNLNMSAKRITSLGTPVADDDAATYGSIKNNIQWARSGDDIYPYKLAIPGFDIDTNVGIGVQDPGANKLEVRGGPIKATGGLILPMVSGLPEPITIGSIWMCIDEPGANATNYDCI